MWQNGLMIVWIALFVILAGAAIYAELTYEPPTMVGIAKAASDSTPAATTSKPRPAAEPEGAAATSGTSRRW